MNRKFILTAGMTCLTIIIAGCDAFVQRDTSPSDVGGEIKSVAIETLAEEIDTVAESNEVSDSEVDTTAAEVAVIQGQPESAEPATKKTKNLPIPEIPQFDHELAEGEYSWSQLLARDSIFPIYNPEFAPAAEAPYDDDELVIGLEINGEAKAYAIGPLNGREMVNDTLGGIPVLVTW